MAKLPQSKTNWFIQWQFRVLPTSQEFKDLTEEQIALIIEQFLQDHPEAAKGTETFTDTEYEAKERALSLGNPRGGETVIDDPKLPPILN